MSSRSGSSNSGASTMGLLIGLAAGVAAGLLAAPLRGSDMRATLRSRAHDVLNRISRMPEEGRRRMSRINRRDVLESSHRPPAAAGALTAPLGEIAQMHAGIEPLTTEARS
jgi:hypothetical protein